MTRESSLVSMKHPSRLFIEQIDIHGWNWRSVGAAAGFFLGVLSPIVGSILTAIAWATGPHWHGFSIQRDGTVLLFLTIPLLIFGAHCLDLMDRKDEGRAPKSIQTRRRDEKGML